MPVANELKKNSLHDLSWAHTDLKWSTVKRKMSQERAENSVGSGVCWYVLEGMCGMR